MNESHSDRTDGSGEATVPKAVAARLSLYSRELRQLLNEGQQTISSSQLGKRLGVTDAQIRKDLAHFGQFGYPGIGYRCEELSEEIRKILGTAKNWSVALVGVGNLGQALLRYRGFGKQGFLIRAAFDLDQQKVGQSIESIRVSSMEQLNDVVRLSDIQIAILAVPAAVAQTVAQQLADAGILGILNFAPVTLNLPDDVAVVGVDLAIELEQLVFSAINRIT